MTLDELPMMNLLTFSDELSRVISLFSTLFWNCFNLLKTFDELSAVILLKTFHELSTVILLNFFDELATVMSLFFYASLNSFILLTTFELFRMI